MITFIKFMLILWFDFEDETMQYIAIESEAE